MRSLLKNYIINNTKQKRYAAPAKSRRHYARQKKTEFIIFCLTHSPTQANEEGWLIDILDYEWNFFIERIQVIKQIDETPLNFILDI